MQRYYFLLTLAVIFGLPTLVAAIMLRNTVSWPELIPFMVLITVIGSTWDIWSAGRGSKDLVWLWQYKNQETLGYRFLGVPIEEYLFFLLSSVYSVYMWEGMNRMVVDHHDRAVWIVAPLVTTWTLVAILIPYILGRTRDSISE